MDLAAGLLAPKEKFIERTMEIIEKSSAAIAYRIEDYRAVIWLQVYNVPGIFTSVMRLLSTKTMGIHSIRIEPVSGGFSLIRAELRSSKKDPSNDVLQLLAGAETLYEPTMPDLSATVSRKIKIEFNLNRCNAQLGAEIMEIALKMGAKLISADLGQSSEGKRNCELCVTVPTNSVETYRGGINRGLTTLKRKIGWLRMSGLKITSG
jgi:hypothetical protein